MNNWISCKDRLPSADTIVLVYNSKDECVYTGSRYGDNSGWLLDACNEEDQSPLFNDITHWMPLPTDPDYEDDAYSKKVSEQISESNYDVLSVLRKFNLSPDAKTLLFILTQYKTLLNTMSNGRFCNLEWSADFIIKQLGEVNNDV